MPLPKSLADADGNPRQPPEGLRAPFRCKTCGERLVWADHYWVCPTGFHSKAKTHRQIILELEELMARGSYGRWTPEGVFNIQRRIERHRQLALGMESRARGLRRLIEQERSNAGGAKASA